MKSKIISDIFWNLLDLEKVIKKNIIFRLVWQLNHLKKIYKKYQVYSKDISIKLIKTIICSINLNRKKYIQNSKIFN